MLRITSFFLLGALVVGCGDDDGPSGTVDGGRDAGPGREDGGPTCSPMAEACNGRDDDCDGTVDEDADFSCSLPSSTGATCVSGRCEVGTCNAGFDDCDADPSNGCEVDLDNDPRNCGACMNDCGAAVSCIAGACAASVASVGAGWAHSCALLAGGSVYCWDINDRGQLGDGTNTDSSTPVEVMGLADAVELSVGSNHTCARRFAGEIVCWGENASHQLGSNSTMMSSNVPLPVGGLTVTIVGIDAGGEHTCAVDDRGNVWCWGSRQYGQLGNDEIMAMPQVVAQQVTGLTDAVQISAGEHHTCAVRRTGRAVCWGRNGERLGDSMTSGNSGTPVEVDTVMQAEEVSAGMVVSCVRRRTGAVTCWGPGLLGDGRTMGGPPADHPSVMDALQLSVGGRPGTTEPTSHGCSLRTPGLTCWGDNADGQTGDGTTSRHTIPVQVMMLTDVAVVAAGGRHTCAAQTAGDVYCWGNNDSGQLGDGTTMGRTTPVMVTGLP